MVKPDVVFFGDQVPKQRASAAAGAVEAADAMLVAGTSLSTLSAFRLVTACANAGKPVLLNDGETRADRAELQHVLKLEARCGDVLSRLAADLAGDAAVGA